MVVIGQGGWQVQGGEEGSLYLAEVRLAEAGWFADNAGGRHLESWFALCRAEV